MCVKYFIMSIPFFIILNVSWILVEEPEKNLGGSAPLDPALICSQNGEIKMYISCIS